MNTSTQGEVVRGTETHTNTAARLFVTMDEAAGALAVSRDTIRRMIRAGELDAVKIRKSVRITVASLEAAGVPMTVVGTR